MKDSLRRERMLRLIQDRVGMTVRELVAYFGVSRMTIFRDLSRLEQQGRILRLHGSVLYLPDQRAQPSCRCGRELVPHQQVNGYCCAHCALLHDADPFQLIFRDFISGHLLAAAEAYFLLNTMADVCCRPAILTFAKESEISNFRRGFGGVIGRLAEALEFLQIESKLANKK